MARALSWLRQLPVARDTGEKRHSDDPRVKLRELTRGQIATAAPKRLATFGTEVNNSIDLIDTLRSRGLELAAIERSDRPVKSSVVLRSFARPEPFAPTPGKDQSHEYRCSHSAAEIALRGVESRRGDRCCRASPHLATGGERPQAALRSGHRLHSRPPRTEVALVPGGGAATEFERPRSRMAREAKILLTRCSQCRALGLAILDTSWLWHCSVSKCVPHTLSISSHLG